MTEKKHNKRLLTSIIVGEHWNYDKEAGTLLRYYPSLEIWSDVSNRTKQHFGADTAIATRRICYYLGHGKEPADAVSSVDGKILNIKLSNLRLRNDPCLPPIKKTKGAISDAIKRLNLEPAEEAWFANALTYGGPTAIGETKSSYTPSIAFPIAEINGMMHRETKSGTYRGTPIFSNTNGVRMPGDAPEPTITWTDLRAVAEGDQDEQ
jgi:hypothetical protein